jgi:hypothetical protein
MTTYQDLQDIHQQLLARREAGEDRMALRQAVVEYIEQARSQAREIARPRDRDQLRANLRFWATYLYDETGAYPDTSLVPANNQSAPTKGPEPAAEKPKPDVIDLPGPIDLPRWVLGVGVTIILLLVALLIFLIPRNATPGTAEKTREQMLELQGTQISVVSTVAALPTATAFELIEFATMIAPPDTATPQPTETPDVTQTMSALRTRAVQTQPSPTRATPTPEDLPNIGPGDKGYLRPALMATIESIPNPEGCRAASIQVQFNLALNSLSPEMPKENIQGFTPQDFAVSISPLNQTVRRAAPLDVNVDGIAKNTGTISAATSYLIQLVDAPITASDVIVRFDAECQQRYAITYTWQERLSLLPQEPLFDERLTLAWNMLAWGPVPQIVPDDAHPWFATLDLTASGGDGTYLYWLYDRGIFEPLPDNQITLYSDDCLPMNAVIGVTSGGITVVREIVLLAPMCQTKTLPTTPTTSACNPQAEVLENVLCRVGPGTVYDTLTSYNIGQLLTLEGRNLDASWLWVLMPTTQRHCWVSAALLSPPCEIEALPVIAAPPTPTGASAPTNTPTATPTPTFTPTPAPTSTSPVSVPQISDIAASSDKFYYQASTCSPNSLILQLKASDINGVSAVAVYYRLTDPFTMLNTDWYFQAMANTSGNNWSIAIYPDNAIPDAADYISATFEYYFKATNTQNVSATSATYNDITLFQCQ